MRFAAEQQRSGAGGIPPCHWTAIGHGASSLGTFGQATRVPYLRAILRGELRLRSVTGGIRRDSGGRRGSEVRVARPARTAFAASHIFTYRLYGCQAEARPSDAPGRASDGFHSCPSAHSAATLTRGKPNAPW